MEKVKIKTNGPIPQYKTLGASGCDLVFWDGRLSEICLNREYVYVLSTGIFLEIPPGFEAQIRPRSSMSVRGINVDFGTIDSDYRGEIKVSMQNTNHFDEVIKRGERIAQLVFAPVVQAEFEVVSELADTFRGHGGFGSTGK